MDIIQKLTQELEVKRWQVEAAVQLIDEGNTIPFISDFTFIASINIITFSQKYIFY